MRVLEDHDEKFVFQKTAACPICGIVDTLQFELELGSFRNIGLRITCMDCGAVTEGYTDEVQE